MQTAFSHTIRIRICGLLIEDDSILLVHLRSPVTGKLIWTPPGGGLERGESMRECLKREFAEETGLEIETEHLVHINEMIRQPFHAVEFYFAVTRTGGTLQAGGDPELPEEKQLLRDVQWKPVGEIPRLPFAPDSLGDKIRRRDLSSFRNRIFSQ